MNMNFFIKKKIEGNPKTNRQNIHPPICKRNNNFIILSQLHEAVLAEGTMFA